MRRIIPTLAALLLTFVVPVWAQNDSSDEVKTLVVMINAELDGGESSGAGIVFNVAKNRLYIVTAAHVVRRGDADAENITVEFWELPGEQFEATLLSPLETSLDMAVLTVRVEDVGLNEADFSFGSLTGGDVATSSSITSIGQGSGRDWVTLVEPTNVIQSQAGLLELQAAGVSQGDSGGGVFSDNGKLLGMITNDAPPALRAITAEALLSELESNRYAVFQPTDSVTPAPQVEAPSSEGTQAQAESKAAKLKVDGISASSVWDSSYGALKSVDGDVSSRWLSQNGKTTDVSLTFLFREPRTISSLRMNFPETPEGMLVKTATLSTPDGSSRDVQFRGLIGWEEAQFDPITADTFTLTPTGLFGEGGDYVQISELELYGY